MDWGNIIGNYVFPIAMCLMLFWKMNEQDKDHKEESKDFTAAIENNTNAITALTEIVKTMANGWNQK